MAEVRWSRERGDSPPARQFRIKPKVRPYSGRILDATKITDEYVMGYVREGRRGYATAERSYLLDEVEEVRAGSSKEATR